MACVSGCRATCPAWSRNILSVSTKISFSRIPCIATVHGLEWQCYPGGYTLVERLKQRTWLELATGRAHGIVTFANNTSSDLYGLKPSLGIPVFVVPEGKDTVFRVLLPAEIDPHVAARYGIRRPFVLSVCSLDPRKNLVRLIKAFGKVSAEKDLDLVLVGRPGSASAALQAATGSDAGYANVIFAGYVPDEDLVNFIIRRNYLCIRRLRGVWTASHRGDGVRTSSYYVYGEFASGGGGWSRDLVDPTDEAGLTEAIIRVTSDQKLATLLSQRGLERAASFSWRRTAEGVLRFIDEIKLKSLRG